MNPFKRGSNEEMSDAQTKATTSLNNLLAIAMRQEGRTPGIYHEAWKEVVAIKDFIDSN